MLTVFDKTEVLLYKITHAILQGFYFTKLLLILQNMLTSTCLKLTIKTLGKNVKYAQSEQ